MMLAGPLIGEGAGDMRRWVITVIVLAFLGLAALEVIASHDAAVPSPTQRLLLK